MWWGLKIIDNIKSNNNKLKKTKANIINRKKTVLEHNKSVNYYIGDEDW